MFGIQVVVQRQFFIHVDATKAYKHDPTAVDPRDEVWFTTVVDEFSAASANPAVNCPALVEPENVQVLPNAPAPDLAPVDSLASVFNNMPAARDRFSGEHTEPVD